MISRFVNRSFPEYNMTTVASFMKTVEFKIGGTELKVQVYDTAGQSRFDAVTRSYLSITDSFVLLYDVNNRETFETLKDRHLKWIQEDRTENKKVILVGNKCDRPSDERQVSNDEGRAFATENGINFFFECSAKDGMNVDTVFHSLGQNFIGFSHVQEKKAPKKSVLEKLNFWSKKPKEIAVITVVNNHPDRTVLFIVVPPKEKDTTEECNKRGGNINATATGGGLGAFVETQAKFIRNDVACKFKHIQPSQEWEYAPFPHNFFDFLILFPKGTDFPHRYFYVERNSSTATTISIEIDKFHYCDGLPEMEVKFLTNGIINITDA